jgi:hypothetical protein
MVAKRKDSIYAFARSRLWLKIKTNAGRAEMQKRIDSFGAKIRVENEEFLSAEFVFSTSEILDDFRDRCELAAAMRTMPLSIPGFLEAAADVCRALDHSFRSGRNMEISDGYQI